MQNFMVNDILELTSLVSVKTRSKTHVVTLTDSKKQKYKLILDNPIPKGTLVKINSFYHDFHIDAEGIVRINPKQKYSGLTKIDLQLINRKEISDGLILEYIEPTTREIFKIKVLSNDKRVGSSGFIDLVKSKMHVKCMSHFHETYFIENWIYWT